MAHTSKSTSIARRMLEKLQKDVPRQLIKIAIQAKIGTRIVARADIKPVRKDVTAKCVSACAETNPLRFSKQNHLVIFVIFPGLFLVRG